MKKKGGHKVNNRIPTVRPGWLYGWADIATFMRCNEKTCRFYEKEFSLPVRHLPTGKVMAHQDRINEWIDKSDSLKKR
jgi:hypothetical protein